MSPKLTHDGHLGAMMSGVTVFDSLSDSELAAIARVTARAYLRSGARWNPARTWPDRSYSAAVTSVDGVWVPVWRRTARRLRADPRRMLPGGASRRVEYGGTGVGRADMEKWRSDAPAFLAGADRLAEPHRRECRRALVELLGEHRAAAVYREARAGAEAPDAPEGVRAVISTAAAATRRVVPTPAAQRAAQRWGTLAV